MVEATRSRVDDADLQPSRGPIHQAIRSHLMPRMGNHLQGCTGERGLWDISAQTSPRGLDLRVLQTLKRKPVATRWSCLSLSHDIRTECQFCQCHLAPDLVSAVCRALPTLCYEHHLIEQQGSYCPMHEMGDETMVERLQS